VFIAVGTSGVVEPAASFVAQVSDRARTIYVGPENPAKRIVVHGMLFGQSRGTIAQPVGQPITTVIRRPWRSRVFNNVQF
jgi:hypothetical protein